MSSGTTVLGPLERLTLAQLEAIVIALDRHRKSHDAMDNKAVYWSRVRSSRNKLNRCAVRERAREDARLKSEPYFQERIDRGREKKRKEMKAKRDRNAAELERTRDDE